VRSEHGRGSEFFFTVPFGVVKSTSVLLTPTRAWALKDLRVLVVDDNATNRRILEETLKSWLTRPTVVDSGQSALQALEESQRARDPYQLILVDAQMPQMDGFSLAQRIKQRLDQAGATIMMLSSAAQAVNAAR